MYLLSISHPFCPLLHFDSSHLNKVISSSTRRNNDAKELGNMMFWKPNRIKLRNNNMHQLTLRLASLRHWSHRTDTACQFIRHTLLAYLLRISQANICGLERLYSFTRSMTSGVVTLGLLPPIWPGWMSPVDLYLRCTTSLADIGCLEPML